MALAAGASGQVANLLVRLMGDATSFTAMMRRAQATVAAASQSMAAAGRRMSAAITAPALVVGGLAVKAFADFEKAMVESTAIMMDVTPPIREEMNALARQMAKESTFSAKQAAESYYFLASAGLSAEASMKALPTVMRFAQAGAFDMALATDLLTDAQSALGLTVRTSTQQNATNMQRLADVLIRANTLANASAQQFSESLTREAGAALKTFGIDVEEGVAVLAAFADQGVKAELAGTALSRILRLATSAAVEHADVYKQLGVAVFDSRGEIRNLADVVEDLEKLLLPLSDMQRVATLDMLGFQARVQGVILPLLGTSKAIRNYEAELRKASGFTDLVANRQLKSFSAQLKLLWNNITDVAISVGEALVPAILLLRDGLMRAINFWNGLNAEARSFIGTVLIVAAVAGPALLVVSGALAIVAAGLGGLATIVGLITAPLAALGALVGVIFSPWAIAIAAVVAGVVLLRDSVAQLVQWIGGGLSAAWDGVLGAMTRFASFAIGWISNYRENIGILIQWIKTNWANLFTDLGRAIVTMFNNMVHNAGVALRTMFNIAVTVFGWLSKKFEELWQVDFVKAILGGLALALDAINKWQRDVALKVANAVLGIFTGEGETGAAFRAEAANVGRQFTRGRESKDLLGTIGQVVREGMGEMKGALEGFEFATEAPEFILNREVVSAIEDVEKAVDAAGIVPPKIELPELPTTPELPEIKPDTDRDVKFEQIALRRFALEGLGGLARPTPKQEVSAPGVERKLDKLIDVTEHSSNAAVLEE